MSTASSPLKQSKSQLRREKRRARRSLGKRSQTLAAQALYQRIARSPQFRFSRRIAFTLANDGEPSLHLLFAAALRRGKQCFLPVLSSFGPSRLTFRRVVPKQHLRKNRYGIPEPSRNSPACPPRTLSLALVPLVAFDAHCNRMGMGKGYYDRTFAFLRRSCRKRPVLLGFAHDCQRTEQVPVEPWDLPLPGIVTPGHWYTRQS